MVWIGKEKKSPTLGRLFRLLEQVYKVESLFQKLGYGHAMPGNVQRGKGLYSGICALVDHCLLMTER